VLLYVMGQGWRREDEWPLRRARRLTLSLAADGQLVEGSTAAGMDAWRVDAQANSLSQGANRWNYGIAAAKAPMSLDASRTRRLEYTSAPMASAREITGHPLVRIQLDASVPTADVYAYLEDVAPDGTSLLVSEGQLRADFHRLRPSQSIVDPAARLRVRPALPYHGFERADADAEPLANGRVLRVEFDLMPVSWTFSAGHRIRLSLAGADEGSFETAPGTLGATWRIQRGRGASALELPFIP
jgi:putative CocE/NonD family hydrolase